MKNKKTIAVIALVLLTVFVLTGCFGGAKTEEVVESVQEQEVDDVNSEANVVTVTEATFDAEVLQSKGIVLVDFWAAWCGPCRIVAPVLEEVSAETGVKIAKVNVDENPNLSNEYGINAIPAIYVFVDGEFKESVIGAAPKENFLTVISKYQ